MVFTSEHTLMVLQVLYKISPTTTYSSKVCLICTEICRILFCDLIGASKYGIKIQENYRNHAQGAVIEARNNIPIVDLKLENIIGVVQSSAIPIYILCADEGCFNWEFTNVLVQGINSNNCNYEPTGFSC